MSSYLSGPSSDSEYSESEVDEERGEAGRARLFPEAVVEIEPAMMGVGYNRRSKETEDSDESSRNQDYTDEEDEVDKEDEEEANESQDPDGSENDDGSQSDTNLSTKGLRSRSVSAVSVESEFGYKNVCEGDNRKATTMARGRAKAASNNEDTRPIGRRLRKRSNNISYAVDSSFIEAQNESQQSSFSDSDSDSDNEPVLQKQTSCKATGDANADSDRLLEGRRPRADQNVDKDEGSPSTPLLPCWSTVQSEIPELTLTRGRRARQSDRSRPKMDSKSEEQIRLVLSIARRQALEIPEPKMPLLSPSSPILSSSPSTSPSPSLQSSQSSQSSPLPPPPSPEPSLPSLASRQKKSPIKYNLRDRDKSKSYFIPLPPLSPTPPRIVSSINKESNGEPNDEAVSEPTPTVRTRRGASSSAASGKRRSKPITAAAAAAAAAPTHVAENEPSRGESQAAGNDELELILPMNLLELGAERCRRAGYVNDDLFGSQPANSDKVSFEDIGGLDDFIESLKEMTVLPLMYPEVYRGFGIRPPRGVLFHGPPGTGKTLMARALAQSCVGQGGMEPIAFFMRRGADCLSKWVGEAERQLRHLFEQARAFQPSIIFFDELDGLAPVRSSRQDQVHSSIVATLLSLMDGIDDRGQVVVIGATNRPDAIDTALRRPGRFDREMLFRLPNALARQRILRIHTRRWTTPLSDELVGDIVERTQGWGGADLSALCTEAALASVRRVAPRIYSSQSRVAVDMDRLRVEPCDVDEAMRKIVPSTRRSGRCGSLALPRSLVPLLGDKCVEAANQLCGLLQDSKPLSRPRMAVCGSQDMGVDLLGAAIAHAVESKEIPVFVLSVQEMFGGSTDGGSPVSYIARVFAEAQRNQPSLVVIPMINRLAEIFDSSTIELLDSCVAALKALQVGILVSATCCVEPGSENDKLWAAAMPGFARQWFVGCLPSSTRVFVGRPNETQVDEFFHPLFQVFIDWSGQSLRDSSYSSACTSPLLETPVSSADTLTRAIEAAVAELCALPMFSRYLVSNSKTRQKQLSLMVKRPIFISTVQRKATRAKYKSEGEFLADIELIGQNILQCLEDHDVDILSCSTVLQQQQQELKPVEDKKKTLRALKCFVRSLSETAKTLLAKHLAGNGKNHGFALSSSVLARSRDMGSRANTRVRAASVISDITGSSSNATNGLSSPVTMPSTPLSGYFGMKRKSTTSDIFSISSSSSFSFSMAENKQQNGSAKGDSSKQLITPSDTETDEHDAFGFDNMGFDQCCYALRMEIRRVAQTLPIEALEPLRAYLIAEASKSVVDNQQQQQQQQRMPQSVFLPVVKALGVWIKEYLISCA
ncbi:TAT-binding protein-like protein 7, AAA ATPase [Coemansia asiatica]|uniref:TAT-binding protein-like protein 7, AAA ATPase n=1 Tax=Coemansia asiatica TaxID=1052880 RepID=A0A9W8CJX2_9FUNG|nr:TAT-binding protein-like protein 7, AAA ATPase [Coemansia asiatica]